MRKVIIATPTYDGRVEGSYAISLAETVRLGQQVGVYFDPLLLRREPIARSRNNMLASFYHAPDYSDLLWIDADQGWNPEQALQLLDHPVDVVGGTYPRTEDPSWFVVKCNPEKLHPGMHGMIEVEALGFGFLKMSRRAVEALWKTGAPYTRHGRQQRWVFDERPRDGDVVSEDVSVCLKLAELGFPVYLDPNITCTHTGPKTWAGNFLASMNEYNASKKSAA